MRQLIFVAVVFLFYIHGKHPWSCPDMVSQPNPTFPGQA